MASTYRTIEELYRTTLVALSESPEAWKAFLESAGRNYKLPFPEQALVHAQRPDATAVLELERWDALFGRRVKRGSVGIAVFGAPGTGRLRYYFDVSDTAPGRAARPLPLWAGGPEQEAAIVGALHESFGADARKGTIEAIAEAASAAVRENAESAVAAIGEARGGSGLERLEAPEAGDLLLELAAASAAYEAASRCGIEGGALITPRAADALPMFGTVRAMNALGCRTASAAAAVLRAIAPAMRERAPEASHRTFAPLAAAVHNPAKEAYREGGGLLLPTLATEEEAAANLGPFALMRDEYLRSSKPELRADLLAQGALARHLAETEALAEAMADDLAARVAKSRGLDEAAKVADPAAWAAKMAEAAAAAREAAAMKVVYA